MGKFNYFKGFFCIKKNIKNKEVTVSYKEFSEVMELNKKLEERNKELEDFIIKNNGSVEHPLLTKLDKLSQRQIGINAIEKALKQVEEEGILEYPVDRAIETIEEVLKKEVNYERA